MFRFGFLFLVPLLCLTGVLASAARYNALHGCIYDAAPLRSLDITIDPEQSGELAQVLIKFAEENKFRYKIAYYSPDSEDFSVFMEREDVRVFVGSPFTRGEFGIYFHNNDCIHPTVATEISGLVKNLEASIGEIPNVTITHEH